MLLSEREHFDAQLAQLCAGFNVPATEARGEAYWRGLERMHLSAFIRVVSHCLGEGGPEKIPTVREIWSHYRMLRRGQRRNEPETEALPQVDSWTAFANRRLLTWLMQSGPVSAAALTRIVVAKRQLTDQFRVIGTEESALEEDFTAALLTAWQAEICAKASA